MVSCNDGIKHFIGFDEESDSYSLSNCHLWTINDANDGDVLVDSYSKDSIIILYKGLIKNEAYWHIVDGTDIIFPSKQMVWDMVD